MKMDVSKFKKVSSDEKKTVFKHPRGHLIEVAHAPLSPGYRKQLKDLPAYSEGGEVEAQKPKTFQNYIDDLVNGANNQANAVSDLASGKVNEANKIANAESAQAFAPAAAPVDGPAPASVAPPALASAAPAVDPSAVSAGGGGADFTKSLTGALGQYGAGVDAQAKAEGELGKQQAGILEQQNADMQKLQQETMAQFQNYMKEADAVAKDVLNGHINPNHYMENLSAGKRVTNAIGLILGGMGAGLTGGENPAAKFIQNQIERDVEAQKANLQNKATLMGHFVRQGESVQNAANLARAFTANIYAAQLEAAAAKSKSPMAMAIAKQTKAEFAMKYAPLLQQAAQQSALNKMAATSPVAAIQLKVPKEMHAEAMKELSEYNKVKAQVQRVAPVMREIFKNTTLGATLSSPIQSAKQREAAEAQLFPIVKAIVGERMTDSDARILIKPYVAGLSTNAKTNEQNIRKLEEQLVAKAAGETPILSQFGIVQPLQASPEVKTMGGVKYQKVPGGWQKVR